MGWWDTSTSTTSNFALTYVQSTTSATDDVTGNAFSGFRVIYNGTGFAGSAYGTGYGTAGWTAGNTVTYGNGGTRRGFTDTQIRECRDDFDAVKRDWKRRRAEVIARRLFRRVAGKRAYRRFRKRGFHEVRGPSGRRYRLEPGQWIKVMVGQRGKAIDYLLCGHLELGMPWFDTMVVQHLMLRSEEGEKKFLAIANRHDVGGPFPIEELRVRQAA